MSTSEDFLTSYRSPIVEYDRETFTMMTEKGRIHRKVDIFFGCLFIFTGLLYALIVQGHSAGIFIAIGFGVYGLVVITLRTSCFWRMQTIDDPQQGKPGRQGQRITYEYFASRYAKNKKIVVGTTTRRWAQNPNEESETRVEGIDL